MNIASILSPEAVVAQLPARDKKQALKLLAARAAQITGLGDREIFLALLEREQLSCTGMGNGVCIPHGRFEGLKAVHVLFGQLERPVDFNAADGKPVDLVVLLLTPADAHTDHLKAIATISRSLRDRRLCESLRKARDAGSLYALLTAEHGKDAA